MYCFKTTGNGSVFTASMSCGPHFNNFLMHIRAVCFRDRGSRALCNKTNLCLLLKRTDRSIRPMQNASDADVIRSNISALSRQSI